MVLRFPLQLVFPVPGNPETAKEDQPVLPGPSGDSESVDLKKLVEERGAEIEKLKKALSESDKQLRIQTQVLHGREALHF